MSLYLRYAERLDPYVRMELDSLVAQLRAWGTPAHTQVVLTCKSPGTLTEGLAQQSIAVIQRRVHVEMEIVFKVATAATSEVYVPLPYTANRTRNTSAVFRTWRFGVGPDGFHSVNVVAGQSFATLLRGDGTDWPLGAKYAVWFQFDYFRE